MVDARRPTRREIAAAETRREILASARRRFSTQGFAGTSVQQIATDAGVAIQTIYASIGPKPAIVRALNDLIDEESDIGPLAMALMAETDPVAIVRQTVHLTRQLNERCGDLIQVLVSAALSDADAAAVVEEGDRRHRFGIDGAARRLDGLGTLKAGTSAEQAAAAISVMTAHPSWTQLTTAFGWTYDAAEEWISASLSDLLLEDRSG